MEALERLRAAVGGGYCPATLDSDPLLASLRQRSEMAEIRAAAAECRRAFAAHRGR